MKSDTLFCCRPVNPPRASATMAPPFCRTSSWANRTHWHERFIAFLPEGATVLDLGCGSGSPVARHMAACGLKITGVDSSPTFISLCRSRLPGHAWIVGDMRSPPLKQLFQGILAWDSFFHLKPADQRKMFAVFHEHAAPSALLMFNAGPRHGEALGTYRGDPALPRKSRSRGVRDATGRDRLRYCRARCRGSAGRRQNGLARAFPCMTATCESRAAATRKSPGHQVGACLFSRTALFVSSRLVLLLFDEGFGAFRELGRSNIFLVCRHVPGVAR